MEPISRVEFNTMTSPRYINCVLTLSSIEIHADRPAFSLVRLARQDPRLVGSAVFTLCVVRTKDGPIQVHY